MVRRRLTLLRHAKSSWKDPSLDDFDRPLNQRGEQDAPVMGRRLKARGARPSLFLTSKARRARRTARLVAREIGYPLEFLQGEQALYLASADELLALLAGQDDSFYDLLVCGHNPGLTDLAARLSEARIDELPTCGIVVLEGELASWRDLPGCRLELVHFDYPKKPASG